jgi:hypothetical protein
MQKTNRLRPDWPTKVLLIYGYNVDSDITNDRTRSKDLNVVTKETGTENMYILDH